MSTISISANSGSPSKDGDGTFVFEDSTLPGVKLTTMCSGKIYQDIIFYTKFLDLSLYFFY